MGGGRTETPVGWEGTPAAINTGKEELVLPGPRNQGQVEGAKPHPGLPGRSYTWKRAAWGSRSHREESTLLLERPPKAKRKGDKHPGFSIPSALPSPSSGLHWLNSDGSQLIQEPRNTGHKGCYPCDEQCNTEQRKVKEWL